MKRMTGVVAVARRTAKKRDRSPDKVEGNLVRDRLRKRREWERVVEKGEPPFSLSSTKPPFSFLISLPHRPTNARPSPLLLLLKNLPTPLRRLPRPLPPLPLPLRSVSQWLPQPSLPQKITSPTAINTNSCIIYHLLAFSSFLVYPISLLHRPTNAEPPLLQSAKTSQPLLSYRSPLTSALPPTTTSPPRTHTATLRSDYLTIPLCLLPLSKSKYNSHLFLLFPSIYPIDQKTEDHSHNYRCPGALSPPFFFNSRCRRRRSSSGPYPLKPYLLTPHSSFSPDFLFSHLLYPEHCCSPSRLRKEEAWTPPQIRRTRGRGTTSHVPFIRRYPISNCLLPFKPPPTLLP